MNVVDRLNDLMCHPAEWGLDDTGGLGTSIRFRRDGTTIYQSDIYEPRWRRIHSLTLPPVLGCGQEFHVKPNGRVLGQRGRLNWHRFDWVVEWLRGRRYLDRIDEKAAQWVKKDKA